MTQTTMQGRQGGTGKNKTSLSGQAEKYLEVNSSEDGYNLTDELISEGYGVLLFAMMVGGY